jgi:hypothetical protein
MESAFGKPDRSSRMVGSTVAKHSPKPHRKHTGVSPFVSVARQLSAFLFASRGKQRVGSSCRRADTAEKARDHSGLRAAGRRHLPMRLVRHA